MTGAFHTLDGVLGPQGRHTPLRPWSRSPPWGCCSPGAPAPPPSKLWGPQVKKGQPAPHAPATQTKSSHSSLAKKGSQRSRCLGLSGRQQAEGLEAGRAHVGDGNGPTRLERRTATGREAAVARGPGWARSIRRPAPANRSVRGDGEGGERALKSRTSVKRHVLDAPQKEKLHVSCAREGSEPLAQAPPASNQPPPPPPL